MKNLKKMVGIMLSLVIIVCIFAIPASAATSKLAAPQNVKATVTNNQVAVTWDSVKGADAYRVFQYSAELNKYQTVVNAVKSTSATIKKLTGGETYKFVVCALKKNGKKYKTGTMSKVVKVTLEKKLTEAELTIDETLGTWEYYDFLYLTPYTDFKKYEPEKKQSDINGWYRSLNIISKTAAIMGRDGWWKETPFDYAKKTVTDTWMGKDFKYKTCTYGSDKFMFMQFINGDGENTYVFRKLPEAKKTKITKVSELAGTWYSTGFADVPFAEENKFDPRVLPGEDEEGLYLESITIKSNKADITYSDKNESGITVNKKTIGGSNYIAYEIDGEAYIIYKWWNDGFYVLQRD